MKPTFEMQAAGDRPRVLVIEPNRNYLGVLARRLSEFGYRVATADTAQSGIAEIYRMPVDLVICETGLPGTSGIEFARMIRADAAHRDTPLLLVVGRSDPTAAIKAFEAGADGVVRKPCHFEVLAACIARQLSRADDFRRLSNDNAALDAKVISRALELREVRDQLSATEAERRRLAAMVNGKAA
jgi:two-component system, OmpR family, phosphate regulon response regulator PhoB